MAHLFRGEKIESDELNLAISNLEEIIIKDLEGLPLETEVVIRGISSLMDTIDMAEFAEKYSLLGMESWKMEAFIQTVLSGLNKEALVKKVQRELGEDWTQWREIETGVYEKKLPLGVLLHIGAGNVLALSVLSIFEGLLSGNINFLKLPSYEGGVSMELLEKLILLEPRLKPYIYAFDISSKDIDIIEKLSKVSNAVVVWGSDEAILGIRNIAPASLKIIEWGHRISFGYFKENERLKEDLDNFAREICLSDQQYCSSPQCVFYETQSREALEVFANRLHQSLSKYSGKYPMNKLPIHVNGEITWTRELVNMESLYQTQKLLYTKGDSFSVMIDYKPSLKTSPLYRNIWVMPILKGDILPILHPYGGYLQTVGLSSSTNDAEGICELLYKAGVLRITKCGCMSTTYSGEPHDGIQTLDRYVRRISKSIE